MDLQDLITTEEWDQTPQAVQLLVQSLLQQVTVLQAEVNTLKERLGQTSRNSSRPPTRRSAGDPETETAPLGTSVWGAAWP